MPKKYKPDDLLYKTSPVWDSLSALQLKKAYKLADSYKSFLNKAKIETEVVTEVIKQAEEEGYRLVDLDHPIRLVGNKKLLFVNKNKSLLAVDLTHGKIADGFNFILAHVDSPRLDLKVRPLYEEAGLAYFKTHYYGGIKKYHWPAIPLEMRGQVVLKGGRTIELKIGTQQSEPWFVISDLLPHLEKERMEKPLKEAIEAEELNVIVGSRPVKDRKVKQRVKLAVLDWLYSNYQIKEKDLLAADIRFVPAFPARDIGLDSAMVGAYGQDDRVCVYTALEAFLGADNSKRVKVLYLADKEEIGSVGITGAESLWLENVLEYLIEQTGSQLKLSDLFRRSRAVSADVTAAYDPDYKNVFDEKNAIYLGHGVVIEKYLGYKGKAMSVDVEPSFLRYLMDLFDKKKISWQTGHLGKVDQGGGGTVAVHLARRNLEVVDMGVAVLNMHAPYELVSKADIYAAYQAYKAFLEN